MSIIKNCSFVFVGLTACGSTDKSVSASEPFYFLVVSDMPYVSKAKKRFPARTFEPVLFEKVFPKLVQPKRHKFLVHVGDIKSGRELCTDKLINQRLDLVYNLYPEHVFYTPGDNDWTDCDRDGRTSELERLSYLRKIYSKKLPLNPIFNKKIEIKRQTISIENAYWHLGDIGFVTLNVPGTEMGRKQIKVDPKSKVLQAADERDRSNRVWLETATDSFIARKLKALVIFAHANIFVKKDKAYAPIKKALIAAAKKFKNPVLLIHGDTGEYCMDQPLAESNFWRLNGPGDFHATDLTEVSVQPSSSKPFIARGLLVTNPVATVCTDR